MLIRNSNIKNFSIFTESQKRTFENFLKIYEKKSQNLCEKIDDFHRHQNENFRNRVFV